MLRVAATIAFAALAAMVIRRRRSSLKNLRSPANPSLFWGHEKLEFEDDQGWQWRQWFTACGKAFKIKAAWGHPDILVMGDTVGLSHIYTKNAYNYAHSPVFRPLIERLTGRGLIWVEGQRAHKRMRALVSPAFSTDNVRNMHPAIYHVSHALRDRILHEVAATGDSAGLVLNVIEYTALATLDIIGRVAFGYDFN
ncbi:cytochrome P450, partial [Exidia glandulosa HHB12029]